jgi:hypothetical protein
VEWSQQYPLGAIARLAHIMDHHAVTIGAAEPIGDD